MLFVDRKSAKFLHYQISGFSESLQFKIKSQKEYGFLTSQKIDFG